jgi:hypothetical protein
MTSNELKVRTAFLKTWTSNGRQLINPAFGNFWIPGKNRKRGAILRPEELKELVDAGIIRPFGQSYQFIAEVK